MKIFTCPDCGWRFEEGFEPKECPNCGCPKSYFTESETSIGNQNKPIENKNIYTCPDCGTRYQEGFVPNECTQCGCPSIHFKTSIETAKYAEKSESNSSVSPRLMIFVILFLGALIGGFYMVYQKSEETKAQAQYEQQEKERVQREEADARRKQKEIEEENERFFKKMTGTYISEYFYYQGTYVKYRISLDRDGSYEIKIIDEYRRVVFRKSGRWEALAEDHYIILDRNSSDWGAIEVKNNHLVFGGVECW